MGRIMFKDGNNDCFTGIVSLPDNYGRNVVFYALKLSHEHLNLSISSGRIIRTTSGSSSVVIDGDGGDEASEWYASRELCRWEFYVAFQGCFQSFKMIRVKAEKFCSLFQVILCYSN